jgi:23S rRNA pseudouridine1911/1915/1917 synthase
MSPKILFEDSEILVLDKPPGVVVDKSETQSENTIENWLESYLKTPELPRMGIVHRLDKDTSGVLLVAKTLTALDNLQTQFAGRITKKEYICLVHGLIEKAGKIEGAIGRNPGDREKFIVLETGKEAVTEYEPIKNLQLSAEKLQEIFEGFNKIQMRRLTTPAYRFYTLLKCHPLTGRTHQIRVHLKHLGFPIVADEKYVGRKLSRLDKRWCPRQFLHAHKLGFNHPVGGEWTEFESPLPDDLDTALRLLRSNG